MRCPELRLWGAVLHTTAVGLPVLLGGIYRPDMMWFSVVTGENGDEIRIIAVREADATGTDLAPPVSNVVERFIGRSYPVREYELTDRVAKRYGLVEDGLTLRGSGDGTAWLVTSHDEHFSTIWPVREPELSRLVGAVLGQLSFVLQRDLDWGEIPQALRSMLRSYPVLRLEAHRGRRPYVRLATEVPAERRNLLQRAVAAVWLPPFETIGRIALDGPTAQLQLRSSKTGSAH